MTDLFLLFNHSLSAQQAEQAQQELGVTAIHEPPPEVSRLWANIPPEPASIREQLEPVCIWLADHVAAGDYVLVQGDFGACYLMVQYVAGLGAVPVYATTIRQAEEEHLADGSVRLTHRFRHVRYRTFGQ
jgi:hypothetical protein